MARLVERIEIEPSEEMKALKDRIEELKKEVDSMERYKKYKEGADEMALVLKAFMDTGFTKEDAMRLILTTLETQGR